MICTRRCRRCTWLRQRLDRPQVADVAGEVRERLRASGLLDAIRPGSGSRLRRAAGAIGSG